MTTVTKIRPNCYRVEKAGTGLWGIVRYTGAAITTGNDWLAEIAFYQTKSARGGTIKRPMRQRKPRYRRVGFYPTKTEAVGALKCCFFVPPHTHTNL